MSRPCKSFSGNANITEPEIAWVAGLLEGEGSFIVIQSHGRSRPRVQMQSTDQDTLERLLKLTQVGNIFDVPNRGINRKRCWAWQVQSWHDCRWLLQMVHPWMGQRRQGQIDLCLAVTL